MIRRTLQDVPLANPSLHLVLPRTIKKITIVGCKLERFSFEMADGGTASALAEMYVVEMTTND
jgi:hypothetical protein